ncbi:MAG: Gfo/Idh/MocA family oxidoreductase [Caldilineaceae bacterium]|nr:Gfo/Idh/MocA family oxidoreductase [Caldilineaceae bacterium]
MTTSPARIAIVGTGWWATEHHIPPLLAHPDAQLVALCDADLGKARMTADAYAIPSAYASVDDLLAAEELDGVIVVTNHATHYPVAKACLQAGLHILIEKPMTLFAREAKELVELAAANKRQIAMGYNHTYAPYTIHAQQIAASGVLGELQYAHGIFNQHVMPLLQGKSTSAGTNTERMVHSPGSVYSDPARSGGGHGHLQITHLASLLFFISGRRVRRVQARMRNHGLAVDLVDALLVEFDNGALGSIGGTGNMAGGRKIDMQLYWEEGWIDIDEAAGTARVQSGGALEELALTDENRNYYRHATTNNFVDIILGRAENHVSGEIGWRAVELLDAAYRSAANNGAAVDVTSLYLPQT